MQVQFNAFLEDISRCFVERDCDLWMSRLVLPFSIITKARPTLLPTKDAVASNFRLYLKAMDALSIDILDRNSISLEDCADGTWLGTFQTRLLSNDALKTAPYTSTALLHYENERFRMSSMLNGRGHTEWTGVTDEWYF